MIEISGTAPENLPIAQDITDVKGDLKNAVGNLERSTNLNRNQLPALAH